MTRPVLLGGVFALLAPAFVLAQGGGVPAGIVVSEDYGAAGEVVEISGIVEGDVYAAGAQVFVDGVVEGDLLALGGTVHILGEVKQNVRVAGGQVVVSGAVGRNVTAAGMNVTLTKEADIKGGVVITGSNVFLASQIGKEARVGGRTLTVAGKIQDDLEAAVKSVRLSPQAKIGGDFTYWSNQEASVATGAAIAGKTTKKSPEQFTGSFGAAIRPFLGASSVFSTLVLGLLLLWAWPSFSDSVASRLQRHAFGSLMRGISVLLLIPVLFGLLILTVVGIPLGLALLLLSSVVLYVARIFVMLLVGSILLKRLGKPGHRVWAFLTGLLVYTTLGLIPVVGWAVSLIAAILGLGALWQTITTKMQNNGKTEQPVS